MKKTFFYVTILACALVAASCQKENDTPNQDAPFFTATLEYAANTKTTVEISGSSETYKTMWESGDVIKINGSNYDANPDDSDARKATFTLSMNQGMGLGTGFNTLPYKAYFPAKIFTGSSASLPDSYDYTEGKYNMPMYAQSETTTLSFNNLCGVFRFSLTGNETVKTITVTANENICGPFSVGTGTDGKFYAIANTEDSDSYKSVTINCGGDGVELSDTPKDFFIPLPPGTYTEGMTITVAGDGSEELPYTKTTVTDITIERNTVYTFVWNVKYLYQSEEKIVIWENHYPESEFVLWSSTYRFGLDGHDSGSECIATFNATDWNQIKTGTFYLLAKHEGNPNIRVTTGWWSTDWPENEYYHKFENNLIKNDDGTCSLEINFGGYEIADVLDQKHLLFTGDGFLPLELYYYKYYYKDSAEPFNPGGGTQPYIDNPAGTDNDWFGELK